MCTCKINLFVSGEKNKQWERLKEETESSHSSLESQVSFEFSVKKTKCKELNAWLILYKITQTPLESEKHTFLSATCIDLLMLFGHIEYMEFYPNVL